MLSRHCFFAIVAAVSLAGCISINAPLPSIPTINLSANLPGISGMAPMSDGRYLIVMDTKAYSEDLRFGAIDAVAEGGTRFSPIPVRGWEIVGGLSNDLEALCALPGRRDEFLAAESSYRDADYGRILHLRIVNGVIELLHAVKLPAERSNGKDDMGYEGLACRSIGEGRYLLALGERGGSKVRPRGSLRFGEFNADAGTVSWQTQERELHAPGSWLSVPPHRDIADLYVDGAGTLWAVAASDPDDYGPFRSLVWTPGQLGMSLDKPFLTDRADRDARWIVDGFKVEALSSPDGRIPGGVLSIGSEDEKLGGAWRVLGPPN
ncbi:hypothetical protein [Solilutibacter tolerans]|uniref:Esterase-like activity of phytase n=1 Tax=Solilutibacter tolerans TaxID=1604334 RepID=A0A1N6TPD4_9GAMM|nr:hypothetical protein [Lysobacter tolerans]SIQ55209.1 hypothetical protein SAMN05421546_1431 [Lysobacter tolerans]